jgi:hypothetical protein
MNFFVVGHFGNFPVALMCKQLLSECHGGQLRNSKTGRIFHFVVVGELWTNRQMMKALPNALTNH